MHSDSNVSFTLPVKSVTPLFMADDVTYGMLPGILSPSNILRPEIISAMSEIKNESHFTPMNDKSLPVFRFRFTGCIAHKQYSLTFTHVFFHERIIRSAVIINGKHNFLAVDS